MPSDESGIVESVPVKGHTRKAKSKRSGIFKGIASWDVLKLLSEEQKYCVDCGEVRYWIDKSLSPEEHKTPHTVPISGRLQKGREVVQDYDAQKK